MGMRLRTPMSAPKRQPADRLERTRRTHAQVRLLGDPLHVCDTPYSPIGTHFDRDLIAQIDELKAGLQFMVAVGPAADDVQEQIELGRSGPWRTHCGHSQ